MASMSTPWGNSHSRKEVAHGVFRHTTASHGGYGLTTDALARMPSALRLIPTYAGPGWYEEDCDWALVALAFPEAFDPVLVWDAVKTVRGPSGWPAAEQWLDSPDGAGVRESVRAWESRNARLFVRSGMGTSSLAGYWDVHFTRVDGQAEATVWGLTETEAFCAQPVDVVAKFSNRAVLTINPANSDKEQA